jgi:hypothetical protein
VNFWTGQTSVFADASLDEDCDFLCLTRMRGA